MIKRIVLKERNRFIILCIGIAFLLGSLVSCFVYGNAKLAWKLSAIGSLLAFFTAYTKDEEE